MTDLQIFDNAEFGSVRVMMIDGEPWFVGKDVADALGYSAARNAIKAHVDAEDKLTHQISASGQRREVTLINESGLYSLILSSKLDSARQFKRWVTSEVLPSIRKTGSYINPNVDIQQIVNPEFLRRIADELEARDKKIAELQPKADYCNRILQSDEALPISIIAQDYGMSAVALNKLLAELKIQHRVGNAWVINSPYNRNGYVVTQTSERDDNFYTHTYWTQKGRYFLYSKLRKAGLLPVREHDEYYLPLNFEGIATC